LKNLENEHHSVEFSTRFELLERKTRAGFLNGTLQIPRFAVFIILVKHYIAHQQLPLDNDKFKIVFKKTLEDASKEEFSDFDLLIRDNAYRIEVETAIKKYFANNRRVFAPEESKTIARIIGWLLRHRMHSCIHIIIDNIPTVNRKAVLDDLAPLIME
jgi:hypothetical protein